MLKVKKEAKIIPEFKGYNTKLGLAVALLLWKTSKNTNRYYRSAVFRNVL